MRWALAVSLVAIAAVVQWRAAGPPPLPATAPANRFSGHRAFDELRRTVGGTTPHPVGSREHDLVRDRVAARLRTLGYSTSIVRRFACNAQPVCATLDNIVATVPGTSDPVVLLVGHYDSVPAAPGAADDGAGVGTLLEIARILRQSPEAKRYAFLIDDGEEAGLLGAEAFVAQPSGLKIDAIINLEARGVRGPSYMFETSRNNGRIGPLVARSLDRPVTTSLFPAIYELLPNDTDLTVFKRAGLEGVNFAFLRDVVYYHTSLDDLGHLSLRTLQHHGDNVLAAARALAAQRGSPVSNHNAVWFDVLGTFVITWPAPWSIPLALLSLLVSCVAAVRLGKPAIRPTAMSILMVAAAIAATAVVGGAIGAAIGLRSTAAFAAHPQAEIAAAWLAGLVVPLALRRAMGSRVSSSSLLVAAGVIYSAAGVAAAAVLPGASYLFIAPAVALAAASLAASFRPENTKVATALTSVIGAIVFLPLASQLYSALGRTVLAGIAVLVALVIVLCTPVWNAGRVALLAGVSGIVVLVAVAMLLPAVTAAHPARNSIQYLHDDKPRWVVARATPQLRSAAPFASAGTPLFPWSTAIPDIAPAPRLALEHVALTADDSRTVNGAITFHVASNRRAQRVALVLRTDAPVTGVRVNGVMPPPPPARFRRALAPPWYRFVVRGEAMDVSLMLPPGQKVEAYAFDYSYGLPAQGTAIVRARNEAKQVPSDDGDMTVTVTRHAF